MVVDVECLTESHVEIPEVVCTANFSCPVRSCFAMSVNQGRAFVLSQLVMKHLGKHWKAQEFVFDDDYLL